MATQNSYTYESLLIVVDPTEDEQPALERALASSEHNTHPTVHIFIGVDLTHTDSGPGNQKLYKHTDELAALLQPLEDKNISYTAEISWASPWQEAILEAARQHEVDMIIVPDYSANKGKGSARAGLFNRLSDTKWGLLRNATCPVYFVRTNPGRKRSTVLAAIKTQTVDAKYDALNEKIISRGKWLASLFGAEFHVVNAYPDSTNYPDHGQLRRITDMDSSKVHIKLGSPEDVIADVAEEVGADIVVIGTLARKGMRGAMRGNTSEKVLNKLPQDVFTLNH